MNRPPVVLMVDDDSEDIYLTRRAFKGTSWNGSFRSATDPELACELLGLDDNNESSVVKDEQDKPDLIILDLNMPEISGVELLKRIRSNKRLDGTPVVIFSTSAEEGDIQTVYSLGANSYVQKPDSAMGMARLVERFLYYWFSINLTPLESSY